MCPVGWRALTVCAIRCGKADRNGPDWRHCLQWLRLALRLWIVGGIVKSGGWRFVVEPLAVLVVCSCCVGCNPPRVNRASVAALVVCVQDSKQESTQEEKCNVWSAMGWIFAPYVLRVGYPCVALVCVAYA